MNMSTNKKEVLEMLDRLGKAVSSGDLHAVAKCYGYPALFLSDVGVFLLENADQVAETFGKGREWYVSQGILATRAELKNFDEISESVVSVDVRWPGFDKNGNENYTETSHYLIHFDADNGPLIRAALTRTKQAGK